MTEDTRTKVVNQMVKVCQEMAGHTSDAIGGVDGKQLSDYYLAAHTLPSLEDAFTREALRKSAVSLGMDCKRLHFFHTDMGPTNVFVHVQGDGTIRIGIIDWEAAGFVPKEWIRTKFRLSGGMMLECYGWEDERRWQWRTRIQLALGEEGFEDVADEWKRKRLNG